jgi:hypothetical protein
MTIQGRTYGRNFWRQAAERGVKSAAQAVAGLLILDQPFDILQANGLRGLGVALGGFVLSIVTSMATAPVGQPDDPSAVAKTNP